LVIWCLECSQRLALDCTHVSREDIGHPLAETLLTTMVWAEPIVWEDHPSGGYQ
jgi:hypothetical protein